MEDLNSKIASSKPADFSLFVLFLLVLFRLYFFSGDAGLGLNGIGYHFEILSSQVDPTKKRVNFIPWQQGRPKGTEKASPPHTLFHR